MPLQKVVYSFTTKLPAARERAYRWATDFDPGDLGRMGIDAHRKVEWITDSLVLLTDSFDADPFNARPGARTVKTKLVHLYPDRWYWTSTHVEGPARHSQFLYELAPRGRNSCVLRFTGAQVESVKRRPTAASIARRARELRREDSQGWRNLVRAMRRELGPARARRRSAPRRRRRR
jgi:hypothetical protein